MPTFSDVSSLQRYIKEQTKIALKTQVAERVKQIIQKFLDEQIYSKPQQEYERYGSLLKSVEIGNVVDSGNILTISIYFTSKTFEEWSWAGDQAKYQAGDKVSMNDLMGFLEGGWTVNRPKTTIKESTISEMRTANTVFIELEKYFIKNGMKIR